MGPKRLLKSLPTPPTLPIYYIRGNRLTEARSRLPACSLFQSLATNLSEVLLCHHSSRSLSCGQQRRNLHQHPDLAMLDTVLMPSVVLIDLPKGLHTFRGSTSPRHHSDVGHLSGSRHRSMRNTTHSSVGDYPSHHSNSMFRVSANT